jgi:hypothetical protein
MPRGFTRPLSPKPLPHHMFGVIELGAEDTPRRATHIPIAICDKSKTGPEDIVTMPGHPDFAGLQDTPMCFPDSTIGKVRIGMSVSMPTSVNNDIFALNWNMGLFALAFEDIEKDDPDDGATLANLFALEKETTSGNENYVRPQYNGTDVNGGTAHSLYVGSQTEMGLTGGDNVEGCNFNHGTIEQYLRRGGMAAIIKDCLGGMIPETVVQERPYKMPRTWFSPPGKVKRMNEFTYFGLGIEIPQAGSDEQFYVATETTNTSRHLRIGYDIYYNEYNDAFSRS